MKTSFWGFVVALIALNVGALGITARAANSTWMMILVPSLFLFNVLLVLTFRRFRFIKVGPSHSLLLDWTSWTAYISVIGGIGCVLTGAIELKVKTCAIGALAIAVGTARIWKDIRMRRVLRDR